MADCVQCGYCCTIGTCPWGRWNGTKGACQFLADDNRCEKYDEIKGEPGAEFSPAFGAGCSSTMFNARRNAVLKKLRAGWSGDRPLSPDAL